jgi:ATP-dependent exoDNAse (exonuclease V) alpha subunit
MKYIKGDNNIMTTITCNNVFLTGYPGSGKSYLTKQYIKMCKINSQKIGITASTGIAAKILGGTTIHSWSGIDIINESDTYEVVLKRVTSKPYCMKRWKSTDVLIIDEISLLDSKCFMYLDMIGKNIRSSDEPFGGIRLLVVGDFFQLPPINGMNCYESEIWEDTFAYGIHLTTNFRSNDTKLNKILKCIRKGQILKPNMILALKKRNKKKVLLVERFPILVPLRSMARSINNKKLNENNNTTYRFNASYSKKEYKDTIIKLSPLEDELILKIGCPVIYLINNHNLGLVNGMVGTVVDIVDMKPVVQFNNIKIIVDKHKWEYNMNQDSNNKANYMMEQFPLLLGYSITIHRSQGQTLSQASIVMDRRMWEKSQIYVALSRLESLDKLNLITFDPDVFNIVGMNDIKVKKYYKKWV